MKKRQKRKEGQGGEMGSGWRRRRYADGKEGDWRRTEQKEGKGASPHGWKKASDGTQNEEAGREEDEDVTHHTPEPPRAR
jgi:hypothetical protein